jgi:WD40 repeat protein
MVLQIGTGDEFIMKTFKKFCLCIIMLVILLGSLPLSVSAEGETELPIFNTLPADMGGWSKLAVSPDGKLLFIGGGYNSYLWHIDSGRSRELETLRKYDLEGSVEDATFSPDGKVLAVAATGSPNHRIMLFDSNSGSLSRAIEVPTSGFVGPIQFSHDGKHLIVGLRWDRISVIEIASGKEIYSVPKDEYINIIQAHPKRNEYAVTSAYGRDYGNMKDLQIRNTGTGEIIINLGSTLPPGDCGILDMRYSPDGKYFIVSLDSNCGTLIYDANNNYKQVASLEHSGSISFSKDSKLAIIGNQVYLSDDMFNTSYGLAIKNTGQLIDSQLSILTPDGKYFITRAPNSSDLLILDATSLSVRLTGIQIEPESISLGLNESQALKVTGIYSDGTSKLLDADAVNWIVSDFYIAEIRDNVLYGLTHGSTNITAEFGGYKKSIPVVVAEYPRNLTASVSEEKINLTWTGVSSTKDLIGYYVYRRTADGKYGDTPLTDFPLKTTSFVDEKVNIEQEYFYIVKAVYTNNIESRPSNEASPSIKGKRIILQIGNPIMKVNEESKEIDPGYGTAPVIYGDRALLPIRALIEELSGKLTWNNSEQKVTIQLGEKNIELWIGRNVANVNGVQMELDVAPVIINQRTMLPLRFIGENLGLNLIWDGNTQIIEINS